jgi:hypothetical protein
MRNLLLAVVSCCLMSAENIVPSKGKMKRGKEGWSIRVRSELAVDQERRRQSFPRQNSGSDEHEIETQNLALPLNISFVKSRKIECVQHL